MSMMVQGLDPWRIGDREFRSRLLIGTGKFSSIRSMQSALEASGAEIVTVALRRVDLTGLKDPQADMLEEIDPKKY
ncbi:MAG: thiazole synthase, partial [Verrucomicrobia bacterium]|nr:thiazole synthase [Verrucomicrobiota bacterium]